MKLFMYHDYIVMFESLFSERGLSLDRLRTLIEVAKKGSIAAAARGDSSRQSLYSRQIKELEEFFGVELVRRSGRVLVLTKAGDELVRLSKESLDVLENFKIRSLNMPYRVTIGAGDSLLSWLAVPVLAELQRCNSPWIFALENLRNSEIPIKLQNMDVDFGIVRTSALTAEGLENRIICSMDYALYIPESLMKKQRIDPETDFGQLLEMFPLTTLGSGSGFYRSLKQNCKKYGLNLQVQCETQSFPSSARLLKSGVFMAILPCMAEKELDAGFIKFTHPVLNSLTRNISLAWNPRLLRVRPNTQKLINIFSLSKRK